MNICVFKVNNRNSRARFEICSKLKIKTLERRNIEQYNTRYWNKQQLFDNFKFHVLQSLGE